MSIPAPWPQVLDFFGTPLVIEPSPGQLSSDFKLLADRSREDHDLTVLTVCVPRGVLGDVHELE